MRLGTSIVCGFAGSVCAVSNALAQPPCETDRPVWVQVHRDVSPSPRYSPASTRGGTGFNSSDTAIFFGGAAPNNVVRRDLWQWTGSDWVLRVADAGGNARSNAAARPAGNSLPQGSILIHGGVAPDGVVSDDILFWPNTPGLGTVSYLRDGPPARFNHAWAGDVSSGNSLMTGGGICGQLFNDAWQVSFVAQAPLTISPPQQNDHRRWLHTIIFDPNRGRYWSLWGNINQPCNAVNPDGRSYAYTPMTGTWTNINAPLPQPRAASGIAYNPSRDDVVIFGGEQDPFPAATGLSGTTWFSPDAGTTWEQLPGPGPSPRRAFNALQYVAAHNQFVLFGGHDGSYLGDTWVLTYRPVFASYPRDITVCPSQTSASTTFVSGGAPHFPVWQFGAPAGSENPAFWNDSNGTFEVVIGGTVVGSLTLSASGTQGTATYTPFVRTPGFVVKVRPRLATQCGSIIGDPISIRIAGTCCDSIDFNNDSSSFDPQDIAAFLNVYAEGPCIPSSAICNDIDFNNDGSLFDPCDIGSFLLMFSEGPCTPCGV